MIKEPFFPTIIYGHDTQLDNNFLANEIVAWSKQNPGVKKTNVNGWHSETNMHELPQFKPLVDELFKMQHQVFKEEWLDKEPVLGNMWANINYKGGYNRPHIHPNSLFSGVYYVHAQPNSGKLVCNDPRPGIQTNMPTRVKGQPPKHLWRECHIDPKPGRIIMFPAWLWHCVEPNESNDIRISVSFNFIQNGFQ
tara:strand:+ start:870 stop:1451 length:582 start_codon:yes stop_codon:yes gene_type:complete